MRSDIRFENATFLGLGGDPEVDTVAVRDGRIVAVGSAAQEYPTRAHIDLGGAYVLPGLNDAHFHLSYYGRQMNSLDLSSARVRTLEDLYQAVAQRAEELGPDEWIMGHGYYSLELGAHPERLELDRRAKGRKVYLAHQCGHLGVASTAALRAAGIDPEQLGTPPVGGDFGRDSSGAATGLLIETARELISSVLPPVTLHDQAASIRAASAAASAMGLTSIAEPGICAPGILPGSRHDDLRAFQLARSTGGLRVRATVMPHIDALTRQLSDDGQYELGTGMGLTSGFGDEWLKVGPVKIIADGSLSGRSAFLKHDYAHEPGNRGLLQHHPETLRTLMIEADRGGWDLAIHAMGDATIEAVISVLEEIVETRPRLDFRPRIEHFSLADPALIQRAARLGIVPVPQSRFIGQFGHGYRRCLGDERSEHCFPIHSLLAEGMTPAGSSDAPISDGNPIKGIADMVRRVAPDGRILSSDERVSVEEAILAYTRGSAYAERTEHWKGRIRPGFAADFTVLDTNLLQVLPGEIPQAQVLGTFIDGAAVYQSARSSFSPNTNSKGQ